MSVAVPRGGLHPPAPPAWLSRAVAGRGFLLGLVGVLVVAGVAHGVNMLSYPYLEADEGTYTAQAWAVFGEWRLAPYTYFYDHAPLGWIQLGVWEQVVGVGHFGYAIASGRVFMLLVQLACTALVYAIAWRASDRRVWVAVLAALLFALSTYGIHYHRRVLLDNIATLWILLSLACLVGRMGLRRVWLSALALGVAVLSKEIAIVLVPAFAVLVARRAPRESRLFAVAGWLALTLTLISVYPLMALLKGELFPSGTALGGDRPHVSLTCSLLWQGSRDKDGGLLDTGSAFWASASGWAHAEPLLVVGGTAAALLAVTVLRRSVIVSMLGWSILAMWLFIGRGGVVLDFYLVPMLPLLALVLALCTAQAVGALPRGVLRPAAAGVACVLALALAATAYGRSERGLWSQDPVAGQVAAAQWINDNIPDDSTMIIDMSMWMDLRDPDKGTPPFTNAQYYWRVGQDPQVRREEFGDDWRNVDYIITTPQLLSDARANDFPLVAPALAHSVTVRRFDGDWPVEVRRVDPAVEGAAVAGAGGGRREPAASGSCASMGT